jgi:hypothetical protein
MTDDRTLLEKAAKAAGIEVEYRRGSDAYYYDDPETGREEWNPLGKDGQALRLAVKLVIDLQPPRTVDDAAKAAALYGGSDVYESEQTDPFANTRRAITRAAASLADTGEVK